MIKTLQNITARFFVFVIYSPYLSPSLVLRENVTGLPSFFDSDTVSIGQSVHMVSPIGIFRPSNRMRSDHSPVIVSICSWVGFIPKPTGVSSSPARRCLV